MLQLFVIMYQNNKNINNMDLQFDDIMIKLLRLI